MPSEPAYAEPQQCAKPPRTLAVRGDAHDVGERGHGRRSRMRTGRAQLPIAVVAPAEELATGAEHARVTRAPCDRDRVADAADLVRARACLCRSRVAGRVAPAEEAAIRPHCAREVGVWAASTERDRIGDAFDRRGREELPPADRAPAPHGPVPEQRTDTRVCGHDLDDAVQAGHLARLIARDGRAIAEASLRTLAPTANTSIVEHTAVPAAEREA
jgi:hypothetical protein